MANDCIGEEVEKLAAALPEGGVLLLENVRFYKEEEKNDPEFAKKLASVADLYVNDAFGTAHRAHASTEGVTKFLRPSVAGFLMQKVQLNVHIFLVSLNTSAHSQFVLLLLVLQ
jgi:phosphoglycerate kinase